MLNLYRVLGTLFWVLGSLATAETRLAAEFEFDLSYFIQNSPIRRYINVSVQNDKELLELAQSRLNQTNLEFKPKADLEPATRELLDRFEFDLELMFDPPKVEIRHKEPLSKAQVKSDVYELVKLFSKDEAEHERLLKHLSAVRAETFSVRHLNLHIHASDPSDVDRVEVFRRYQLLTALELINENHPSDARRVLTSITSSYNTRAWARGIGRNIGVSRYESRKRALPIMDDIDRVDNYMQMPPEQAIAELQEAISLHATPNALEKVLDIAVDVSRQGEKLEFVTDIYSMSATNSAARYTVTQGLFSSNLAPLQALTQHADELATLYFLARFMGEEGVDAASQAWMENKTKALLENLDDIQKRDLLSRMSRELPPEKQREFFSKAYVEKLLLSPIQKIVQHELSIAPIMWRNDLAFFISINPDHLPQRFSDKLNKLQHIVLAEESYRPKLKALLYLEFNDNPRAFLNAFDDEDKHLLFSFLDEESDRILPEHEDAFRDLSRKYYLKRSANNPAPKNCKEAL